MKNLINVCFNKNFKQYKIMNTIYKTKGMKIFFLLTLFGSFLQSCTKDPTGSGCQPAKDIYFRFTDTFATSLVDVYKQGDTLKLKHNSGTIYYFIATKNRLNLKAALRLIAKQNVLQGKILIEELLIWGINNCTAWDYRGIVS